MCITGLSAYFIEASQLLLSYASHRSLCRCTCASFLPLESSSRVMTGQHPLQDENMYLHCTKNCLMDPFSWYLQKQAGRHSLHVEGEQHSPPRSCFRPLLVMVACSEIANKSIKHWYISVCQLTVHFKWTLVFSPSGKIYFTLRIYRAVLSVIFLCLTSSSLAESPVDHKTSQGLLSRMSDPSPDNN